MINSEQESEGGCEAPDQDKMCPQGHDQTNLTEEKRQRIREQSRTVATYIETNEQFEKWFYQIEGFGFRSERFYSDCEYGNNECLRNWLLTAWQLGYEAGCNRD